MRKIRRIWKPLTVRSSNFVGWDERSEPRRSGGAVSGFAALIPTYIFCAVRVGSLIGKIKLPEEMGFADYADIAIRGKHVAIVSQAYSALWVGKVDLASSKDIGKRTSLPVSKGIFI